MPSNIIKSFSDKTGKSISDVEKMWKDSEDIVSKDYKDISKGSDKYYSLVTGILKNMLQLEDEASITTTSMGGENALHYKKIGDTSDRKMKKIKKYLENI